MKIKVISFDIDGTLVDFNYNRAFFDEAVTHLYSKRHNVSLEEAKKAVFKEYKKIKQKDPRWYKPSFWFRKFGIGDYKAILRDLKHHVNVYPDTIPSLKRLSKKFMLVIITSNTEEFINIKLKAENISQFFSKHYSVTEMFMGIKSPAVFSAVIEDLRISTENMVHVGDDPLFDYFEPRKLGINSFLLGRGDVPSIFVKPNYMKKVNRAHIIKDLNELVKKLDELGT